MSGSAEAHWVDRLGDRRQSCADDVAAGKQLRRKGPLGRRHAVHGDASGHSRCGGSRTCRDGAMLRKLCMQCNAGESHCML